jgi:hypothetical protein
MSKQDCSMYMYLLLSLFCRLTGKDAELCINELIGDN